MARRKIVFVIVEGPSDDTALGMALNRIYNRDSLYVHIVHGDITTRGGSNSRNIVNRVEGIIKKYAYSQHYKKKDFREIVHIVDTDAVYIPDENVIEDMSCRKVSYRSKGIYTANTYGIIARNEQKRLALSRLINSPQIWGITYHVYYMSCNLDHVLYDKRNCPDDEKEKYAYQFAMKYKDDIEGFVDYICDSPFSIRGSYRYSWDFIATGMNSIGRYTNLCICIEDEIERKALRRHR